MEERNTLTTPALEELFKQHPLYSQDGLGNEAVVLARYFLPATNWAWYVLEAGRIEVDEETAKQAGIAPGSTWECYGITINENVPKGERGYFWLSQLEAITLQVPLVDATGAVIARIPQHVELDRHFNGKKVKDIKPLHID